MNFLLDTNIVWEWVKPRPEPTVVAWLSESDEDRIFLSVASLAEIRRGVESMSFGRRRDLLVAWLFDELPTRFEGRVLAIDQRVAFAWGLVMARSAKAGKPIGTMDAFFAATADTFGLTIVTRNVMDFQATGVDLFNPWLSAP